MTLGIKFLYPSQWIKEDQNNSVVLYYLPPTISPDRYLQTFKISVINPEKDPVFSSTNMSLTEITNKEIDYLHSNYNSFRLLSFKPTTIMNKPASMLIYEFIDQNFHKFKVMEILTINDNKVCVIFYYANPSKFYNHLTAIQSIIKSLKFTNTLN